MWLLRKILRLKTESLRFSAADPGSSLKLSFWPLRGVM